ncbi:hypothetical protein GCK32_005235 [Trichostrongylus colubriformis]|uniref:Uncharacterized protein n=1 Tax=Trichostrongylus colubriformis TaxID=6319 RepID=A0AAN8F8F6_TRICO
MTSSMFEEDLMTRKLNDSLYKSVNIERLAMDVTDYAGNRHCSPASRNRLGVSVLHETSTPKSTKIPTLMSRSLSASYDRNRILCSESPIVNGSREQLCRDGVDAQREARQLLERSRSRPPIRVAGYEPRCLLSSNVPMMPQSSSLPLLHQSHSRPRLLQRPQIPRRGEQPSIGVRSFSARCETRNWMQSEDLAMPPAWLPPQSAKTSRRLKAGQNKLGGRSLDVKKLVALCKSSLCRCRNCRCDNSLRRRVSKYNPRFIPSGIGKYNVVRRSLCICGRDANFMMTVASIKSTLLDPMAAKKIANLLDWAALFALIAICFNFALKLLDF